MEKEYLKILWNETVVGTVFTKDKMYKYVPNRKNIEKMAKNQGMPCALVVFPQEYEEEMPKFVEQRLKISTKEENYKTATDKFSIIKINE